MYSQCPYCNTINTCTEPQLKDADGILTCTKCCNDFNALYMLTERMPEEEEVQKITPEQVHVIAREDLAEMYQLLGSSTATAHNHSPIRTLGWFILTLSAILLLAGQYGYFMRDHLARYPQLRPWLEQYCSYLNCEIPPRRDVSRFSIINRDIRTHPAVKNALMINLGFSNEASFTQPYPALQVSFFNADGKLLARRLFQPGEYLANINHINGIAPGAPVHALLEIVDPDPQAFNFEFEFF